MDDQKSKLPTLKLQSMSRQEVDQIRELAKELYVTGEKEAPQIIAELRLSTPTFYKWAREKSEEAPRTWHELRADFYAEQRHLVETYKALEEKGGDFEELHKMNMAEISKMTAIAIAKLKKLLLSENPLPLIGEIQKASASLEKQGSAYYKDKNKGVDKSQKTTVNVSLDTDRVMDLILAFKTRGVDITWDEANKLVNPTGEVETVKNGD